MLPVCPHHARKAFCVHTWELVIQSRRPVNIYRLHIQLKNVCSHVHQRAKVWFGSPKVSMYKFFNVGSSLGLQMQTKMMLIQVVCLHRVNGPSSHSQRPSVKDSERCFLVNL